MSMPLCIRPQRQPALLGVQFDQLRQHRIVRRGDLQMQRRTQPRGKIGQADGPRPVRRAAGQQQRHTAFLRAVPAMEQRRFVHLVRIVDRLARP